MRALVMEHPASAGLALLAAASLFRLIDIFVLRLDALWGEIILSKIAAALLLLAFLAATGARLAAMGFHGQAIAPSVLLGASITIAGLTAGYAVEILMHAVRGERPSIVLVAIDPKSGLAGAAGFALFLLAGNIINSFAEEGLFRGVLIPLFLWRTDLWTALAASAFLFGLWHLPWAVRAFLDKSNETPLAWLVTANFLPQMLLGLVWGYLFVRTGNLWGPWLAHTLTNSAVNFVHVRGAAGIDAGLPARIAVFAVVMLISLIVIQKISEFYALPAVGPWGEFAG